MFIIFKQFLEQVAEAMFYTSLFVSGTSVRSVSVRGECDRSACAISAFGKCARQVRSVNVRDKCVR